MQYARANLPSSWSWKSPEGTLGYCGLGPSGAKDSAASGPLPSWSPGCTGCTVLSPSQTYAANCVGPWLFLTAGPHTTEKYLTIGFMKHVRLFQGNAFPEQGSRRGLAKSQDVQALSPEEAESLSCCSHKTKTHLVLPPGFHPLTVKTTRKAYHSKGSDRWLCEEAGFGKIKSSIFSRRL